MRGMPGSLEEIMAKLNRPDQVKKLNPMQAQALLAKRDPGEVTLLDVRQDWEYEEFHLPGAKLLPLDQLADRLAEIPRDKPLLVYCRSGTRSAAAAALLAGQGFPDVSNILGGVMAWTQPTAAGPADAGMHVLTGRESREEILIAAYGMEQNLAGFYRQQAKAAEDPHLSETLAKLAGFEEKHKGLVYRLYKSLCPESIGPEEIAAKARGMAVEGGRDPGEVMASAGGLDNFPRVLELAMAFEAQALDLYLRCASQAQSDQSRDLLRTLAREEKRHLKVLGAKLKKPPLKEAQGVA